MMPPLDGTALLGRLFEATYAPLKSYELGYILVHIPLLTVCFEKAIKTKVHILLMLPVYSDA